MKKVILQLHLWVGLAVALFLIALGVSGALLVFEDQIDHALNPKLSSIVPLNRTLSLTELQRAAEQAHPGYRATGFFFSGHEDIADGVDLEPESGRGIEVAINQHTGEVLGTWDDDRFVRKLHGFHTHLLAGKVGSEVVGWGGGVLLLFLSITGLMLWWPRKLRVFRWSSFGTKFHYDLHNTIGFYASAFILIFSLTGIAIHWEQQTDQLAAKLSGSPARPPMPKIAASDAKPLPAEQLVSAAQKAAPEARITGIQFPNDAQSPAIVAMKFPEDHTPAGRTRAFVDPYSGKLLMLTSSREMPWAVNYARVVNRELHTGDIYGWSTKIIAALFSLGVPVLAITGPLIWWNRKMAARRASSRKQAVAVS